MTDKEILIAFRSEVERLKDSCASPIVICDTLLSFIDSMQEEYVNYDKLNTMLDDALAKETKESLNERLGISQEEHDRIVDECIYGKEPELVDADDLPKEEPMPKFKAGDHIRPIDSSLGAPRTILEVCDDWYVTNQGTLDFEFEDNWEAVEEPVSDKFAFKAIPRLLEMLEPTDRAKAYIAKLADTLEVEGYLTDAKIVRESLKIMNDEKVPIATMDEEPVSDDLEEEIVRYIGYPQEVDEDVSTTMIRKAARHFANWQKEKMMKHAVEGVITFDYYGDGDKTYGCIAHDSFCLEDRGLKDMDKVKIAIIKED